MVMRRTKVEKVRKEEATDDSYSIRGGAIPRRDKGWGVAV